MWQRCSMFLEYITHCSMWCVNKLQICQTAAYVQLEEWVYVCWEALGLKVKDLWSILMPEKSSFPLVEGFPRFNWNFRWNKFLFQSRGEVTAFTKLAPVFMNREDLRKYGRLLIFSMNEDSHPERNEAELSTVAARERERDGRASNTWRGGKRPYMRAERLKPRTWGVNIQRLLRGACKGSPGAADRAKERGSETGRGERASKCSSQPAVSAGPTRQVSRPPRCSGLQPCRNSCTAVPSAASDAGPAHLKSLICSTCVLSLPAQPTPSPPPPFHTHTLTHNQHDLLPSSTPHCWRWRFSTSYYYSDMLSLFLLTAQSVCKPALIFFPPLFFFQSFREAKRGRNGPPHGQLLQFYSGLRESFRSVFSRGNWEAAVCSCFAAEMFTNMLSSPKTCYFHYIKLSNYNVGCDYVINAAVAEYTGVLTMQQFTLDGSIWLFMSCSLDTMKASPNP